MAGKHLARTRRTESDWRAIMARFRRSGKTQEAFCREAGLASSTFQIWSRRLRASSQAVEFVDVSPASIPQPAWSIEITFPDGTTARLRG